MAPSALMQGSQWAAIRAERPDTLRAVLPEEPLMIKQEEAAN